MIYILKNLPPLAALDAVAHIGLADDGDVGLGVAGVVHVASGSDGNESGNQDLKSFRISYSLKCDTCLQSFVKRFLTSCMLVGEDSSVEDQLMICFYFSAAFYTVAVLLLE